MRRALLAVCLLFPVVMLPQVFLRGEDRPRELKPAWVHIVVVTAKVWPAGGMPEGAAFERLNQDGVRMAPLFSPSDSSAAAAAGLWSGRWPRTNGVTGADRALPAGAWTLASTARSTGAATAARLEEPFATVTGIGGFDDVREEPRLAIDRLAEDVAAFYERHPDQRTVLWVHLADAGPRGSRLADAIGAVQQAIGDGQRRLDTLTLITGLAAGPGPYPDSTALVPLFAELPTRLNAGTVGTPHLSLVDVAGGIADVLRLPYAAAQSRAAGMLYALSGGRALQPVEVRIGDVPIYRRANVRVVGAPGTAEALDQGLFTRTPRPLSGNEAAAALREAFEWRAKLNETARPAPAAQPADAWDAWR